MNKDMEEMISVAQKLGWSVHVDGDDFAFRKHSPAGQDFNMDIKATNLEDAVEMIKDRCDGFDCSEEAYIWLDGFGHGTNGAPHDMKDVYEDMEACLDMMKGLHDELKSYSNQRKLGDKND